MDDFGKYLKKAQRTFWTVFITNMILSLFILGGIIFAGVYLLKMFW